MINIINKHKNIIESKKTDKVTWKEKKDTWETITNEFNAVAPSGTYHTTDSLKKFYENMKKETRKMAAQKKMEQFKIGGRRPAHKVVDPMDESILALMNTKTVKGDCYKFGFSHNINFISNKCTLFIGLNNMFDSDTTNTPNSLSISDASNTLDDVTNSAV